MYSYEDRIRAVELYVKLGKRISATIRQLGYSQLRTSDILVTIRTARPGRAGRAACRSCHEPGQMRSDAFLQGA